MLPAIVHRPVPAVMNYRAPSVDTDGVKKPALSSSEESSQKEPGGERQHSFLERMCVALSLSFADLAFKHTCLKCMANKEQILSYTVTP